MNRAVAETRKAVQQNLGYHVPRWIVVFLALTFIQELTTTQTGHSLWHIPSVLLVGLLEGAFGGLVFVGLQRWLNPRDSGAKRIRNYFVAIMAVGVGSLCLMTMSFR